MKQFSLIHECLVPTILSKNGMEFHIEQLGLAHQG